MSVRSYIENEKTLWKVYVNLMSKVDPTVRVQKHSLGFKTIEAAEKEEKRLLQTLSAKLNTLEGKGTTWGNVIDKWELAMRTSPIEKYSPITIQDYANALRNWTGSWLNRFACEITKGDGREVLEHMEREGKSYEHQRHLKNTINLVYNWAIEKRLVKGIIISPVVGLPLMKKSEKAPGIFTLEEIKRLLFEAKRLEHSWFPIWSMALLTGMRNGELHALLWADVNFEAMLITCSKSYNIRMKEVKSTKAGYYRNIPISSELHSILLELKLTSAGRQQVLPRSWEWDAGEQAKILRMFCKGIGLKEINFHALRACFATQLISQGIAPIRIMKICGWKDLKTMERYIRLAGVDEKGATESLRILPDDATVMGEVVELFKPKSR